MRSIAVSQLFLYVIEGLWSIMALKRFLSPINNGTETISVYFE